MCFPASIWVCCGGGKGKLPLSLSWFFSVMSQVCKTHRGTPARHI
jgi:hypothetical protein